MNLRSRNAMVKRSKTIRNVDRKRILGSGMLGVDKVHVQGQSQ